MSTRVCCGFVAVFAVAALGACGGSSGSMTDDIDRTWDFGTTVKDEPGLAGPYVRGAKVLITARAEDDPEAIQVWSVVSSDPAVFRIDEGSARVTKDPLSSERLTVFGDAVGEGTATLRLLDRDGGEVHREALEVVAADRLEVAAYGAMVLGQESEAVVSEVRQVENSRAAFQVRYFREGRELFGQGALRVASPMDGSVVTSGAYFFERREWLLVAAGEVGMETIDLTVGGVPLGQLPLVVVPLSEVKAVEVQATPEAGHAEGDWLTAVPQAYDGNGARVFGVGYVWRADGLDHMGGEVYRYQLKYGATASLQVTVANGAYSATTPIHAGGGYALDGAGSGAGCSSSGGGGSLVVGLVGIGLLCGRRRRRDVMSKPQR